MEEKIIQTSMNQTPCGERLLANIVSELYEMKDNEDYPHVKEAYDLGIKLLSHSYYEDTLSIGQKIILEYNKKTEDSGENVKNLLKEYNEALEREGVAKELDYFRLFSLIFSNIEEWC